jgi:hypothetical protein
MRFRHPLVAQGSGGGTCDADPCPIEHTHSILAVGDAECLRASRPIARNPGGSAGTFSVLAGATVTNTGPTAISGGNLGVSPGTAVTGFPPGSVLGGAIHAGDATSALAQVDLTAAFNDAAGRPLPAGVPADIGGLTLGPGLYKPPSSLALGGSVILDGGGNTSSVFIFQIATTLTTSSSSQVILQNGARAANIFWQVGSSATLGTGSLFNGIIMAQASITLTTGVAFNGRALARSGAVTMDATTLVSPPVPAGGPFTLACPLGTAQIGVPYNSLLVATGGTPPFTFSITGPLPPGLNLTASTGVVAGTPTGGSASFAARVVDTAENTAASNCTITTTAAPPPSSIPTLSNWGMGVLALFLAGYSVQFIRKTRRLS